MFTTIARRACAAAFLGMSVFLPLSAEAQQRDFSNVKIEAEKVADGIYMLTGRGGNMAISVGEDGVFLVDDQFAPLSEKIEAAIKKISDKPVQFVINTHWHPDHVGGNEHFGKRGAVTVAHINVRERLSRDGLIRYLPGEPRTPKAKTGKQLPIVTFSEEVVFHFNGQTIQVFELPHSHTDGDSAVFFVEANVIHVGDVIRVHYPFIDVVNGGSLDGTIEATNLILELMDKDTRVISGHAPVIGRAKVTAYRDMLETVRRRIGDLVAVGKTEEEILRLQPLKALDEKWGGGFISADRLIRAVVADLTGKHDN